MKPSLEEERRHLLEQIEASRAVYRRMLSGEPGAGHPHAAYGRAAAKLARSSAGRSRAVQWMMDHPLWVAGGVALLVLAAPRLVSAGRHVVHRRRQDKRLARRKGEEASAGTVRALLTAAVLLMRDPARLRAAVRFAGNAWEWLQRRR